MKQEIIIELEEHLKVIKELELDSDKIEKIVKMIIKCYKSNGKVVLFGNGGSSADAQHIAGEFVGKFKKERKSLPAIALTTNTSIMSAIGNDYGFDKVFERQVEGMVNNRDIVIGISTSGNSDNVIKGLLKAKEKGAKTIALTGKSGGQLKEIVNVLFNVSSNNTPRIQEAHITIGHIICGLVEKEFAKKEKKVLFIIPDVYQEDNYFPLGIGYMAAILKKQGVKVTICCQDVFHYSNKEVARSFLEKEEYDLIGIGFLAARFKETIIDLCATVNEHKKGAWLVLGGHGATPIPEYVLKKTGADVVALGEAEETIVELLDCKVEGGDLSKIKGIVFRKNDEIIVNERRNPIRDLDSLPFPEWSLFPMKKYTNCMDFFDMNENDKAMGMLSSRGCINRCNFCYRMESAIRLRSIESVVEEIKILNQRYGVTYFSMLDELFVFPKKRVFDFAKALKENNLKIKFDCNARVDVFDEEIAVCLKESGCTFLNFGMESSSQKVLDLMHKNTKVEQNIEAAEITKKVGISIGLNFLWGNKGDTEESLRGNVELIKRFNSYDQIRTIRPPTPYPGCELYYEAIKRGLLTGPEDFFNKFKNSDLLMINFTDIPEEKFYKLLFEANKELILDFFEHTTKDMVEANKLIKDFSDLYFGEQVNFRGARHYEKDEN